MSWELRFIFIVDVGLLKRLHRHHKANATEVCQQRIKCLSCCIAWGLCTNSTHHGVQRRHMEGCNVPTWLLWNPVLDYLKGFGRFWIFRWERKQYLGPMFMCMLVLYLLTVHHLLKKRVKCYISNNISGFTNYLQQKRVIQTKTSNHSQINGRLKLWVESFSEMDKMYFSKSKMLQRMLFAEFKLINLAFSTFSLSKAKIIIYYYETFHHSFIH